MKKLNKVLALALAASMVVSLAACGKGKDEPASSTPTKAAEATKAPSSSSTAATPTATPAPLKITVSLPSTDDHVEANPFYDRLVKEINDYTNMDITWEWSEMSTYYDDEHLGLKLTTGDVADVLVVGINDAFYSAAADGLFWDLGPYIDEFDNLATIPQGFRDFTSSNGKMYGLPRSRTYARNGLGYRLDWLNNLGLAEPTDWDSYVAMLRAFTYDDPDGDGIDNTVGLGVDQWQDVWNILMLWFGAPNGWGIDKNGDLIYKYQTEEYKTAMKAVRDLYAEGLINNGANGIPDFMDASLTPGKARDKLLRTQLAGSGIQVLDDQRKVQTYFQTEGITTPDQVIYTVQGYVDTGKGAFVLPALGGNNMLAISTVNIKTEAQLRQVLQFLNDLNDGEMLNLIEFGFKDETYYIDEDGWLVQYTGDELTEKLNGASTKYNDGFNQVLAYFTADANKRPYEKKKATDPINLLEEKLYAEDVQYCVTDYGLSYEKSCPTYAQKTALNTIVSDAQLSYIRGELDEAGFLAAIDQWGKAGGNQFTKEINELWHKAGN